MIRRRRVTGPLGAYCRLAGAFALMSAFASTVHAQPKAPAAPAPPAMPAVPATPAPPAAPKLPAAPAPPSVPAAPSLPAAPAAPASPVPAAPPPRMPAAPPSGEPTTTTGETRDSNVVLLEDKPSEEAEESGVPATLPRALARNVSPSARRQLQDRTDAPLTIEEVTNPLVFSASKRPEAALSAPSWVIVLTAKDLRDRGYTELSQLLDDLPGMDVNRPSGDVYVRSYWRGYRPGAGSDPYLIMVDGIVFNSLFFKDTQILSTFPLSNIERVEVVYGPASALYGPNAAMGLINVITNDGSKRAATGEYGTSVESRITFGGPQRNLGRFDDATKIADATVFHTTKDYRLRISTRLEHSVLDTSIGNDFEYTKDRYYSDPRTWGGSLVSAYPVLSGRFRSPDDKRAVDARLFLGEGTELGAQYYQLSTGLGSRYPADRVQTETPWTTSELSVFGQHSVKLSESVFSRTLIQYRSSSVEEGSFSVFRARTPGSTNFDDVGPSYISVRAPNSAVLIQQDLNIAAGRGVFLEGDQVTVDTGLRYQHMALSRNYVFDQSVTFPLGSEDPLRDARDDVGTAPQRASTQLAVDAFGPYLLARYLLTPTQTLNVGGRLDYSTLFEKFYGTFRGGYVGSFDKLTLKALYGQAVDDPPPLIGSRAKSELLPELSQTIEANAEYTIWKMAFHGDIFNVSYSNPIVGARNLSERTATGFDLGVRFFAQPFHVWAYYSRYLMAETSRLEGGVGQTGDLAFNKVWGGATFDRGAFTATVLGRFMGEREPVSTNPLGTVPAYFVMDANVRVSHVFFDGLWFALRGSNLLDTRYQHPGQESAGGGATPGIFSGATYIGSRDEFNSRLPQARRAFFLTIGFDT